MRLWTNWSPCFSADSLSSAVMTSLWPTCSLSVSSCRSEALIGSHIDKLVTWLLFRDWWLLLSMLSVSLCSLWAGAETSCSSVLSCSVGGVESSRPSASHSTELTPSCTLSETAAKPSCDMSTEGRPTGVMSHRGVGPRDTCSLTEGGANHDQSSETR